MRFTWHVLQILQMFYLSSSFLTPKPKLLSAA
jgi:hypothetical protein